MHLQSWIVGPTGTRIDSWGRPADFLREMSSPYKNVSPKKVCGQLAIPRDWVLGLCVVVMHDMEFLSQNWDIICLMRLCKVEKLTENLIISKLQLVLNKHLISQNRIEIAKFTLYLIFLLKYTLCPFCNIIHLTVFQSKFDNGLPFMWRSWQWIYRHSTKIVMVSLVV